MTYFTDLQTKRRSIYALGKDLELSNQELIETIQGAETWYRQSGG